MKKIVFFLSLVINFFCFSQENRARIIIDTLSSSIDSEIVFVDGNDTIRRSDMKRLLHEEMKLSRENCKKDSLRAMEESKYNMSYSIPVSVPAMNSDFFLAEKELIEELRKNNLGYGGYIIGNCFGIPDNCFQWEMNRQAENKYGKAFFEKLKKNATKQFLIHNPERIFEFEECDMESRYTKAKTYKEMMDMMKLDFNKIFVYPEGFELKKTDQYSYSEANFILDKKGNVSNIYINTSLKSKKNYIFTSYLQESLEDFVKKSKWKPATYHSIPVKSKMNVLIFYK